MDEKSLKRAGDTTGPDDGRNKRPHLSSSFGEEELNWLRTKTWTVVAEKLNSKFGTCHTAESCRNQRNMSEKCELTNCHTIATAKYVKCSHAVCHTCYRFSCGVCHDFSRLPDVVLESIFLKLDPWQVAGNVQYVCKSWLSVIDQTPFWKAMCVKRGVVTSSVLGYVAEYRTLCLKQTRNLLKTGWPRNSGGPEVFEVVQCYPKAVGCGCAPLPQEALDEAKRELGVDAKTVHCWTWKDESLWINTTETESVDLLACGLTGEQLDGESRPGLLVSVWTTAHKYSDSYYILHAELFDGKRQTLEEKRKLAPMALYGKWTKVSIVFEKIPRRTRYVDLYHSGTNPDIDDDLHDESHGEGKYVYQSGGQRGPKFTGKTVELILDRYPVL